MDYKWFIGIDISKKTLDVVLYNKKLQKKSPYCQISNDAIGFKTLTKWLKEQGVKLKHTLFCMEHTGIYGIELAKFLSNRAKYCFESPLHIKRSIGLTRGKNDKIDAFQIARFCYLHRENLIPKKIPSMTMLTLKGLINERERLVKVRTMDKIVIKELNCTENNTCICRAKIRIDLFSQDITQIEKEIEELIKSDLKLIETTSLQKALQVLAL